jgi:hypothetical protein
MEYDLYGIIKEEESGKVFYKPKEQEVEYLLYDFGMNVNDTAVMYWCQNPNCEVHVRIDSIATQHIAGSERKVFYVSSKDMYSDWIWLNTWVEGIGAMEGLLYSCHVVSAGGITLHELLCYHEDGELVWQNPIYNTCLIDNYDGIQDNTVGFSVQVYPNPAKDKVVIEGIEASEVQVYNALGQMVKTVQNANEINVSDLMGGVYLLRITAADGKCYTNRVAVRR